MSGKALHTGGCHCGKVRYEVELDLGRVMACNCSICSKKATLLAFAPMSAFKLVSGESDLSDYQFNKHVIHHLFCATCGVQSFARGVDPKGNAVAAINVRCLDGIDPGALNVITFDGKSL